jgi:hypothetical protein
MDGSRRNPTTSTSSTINVTWDTVIEGRFPLKDLIVAFLREL